MARRLRRRRLRSLRRLSRTRMTWTMTRRLGITGAITDLPLPELFWFGGLRYSDRERGVDRIGGVGGGCGGERIGSDDAADVLRVVHRTGSADKHYKLRSPARWRSPRRAKLGSVSLRSCSRMHGTAPGEVIRVHATGIPRSDSTAHRRDHVDTELELPHAGKHARLRRQVHPLRAKPASPGERPVSTADEQTSIAHGQRVQLDLQAVVA